MKRYVSYQYPSIQSTQVSAVERVAVALKLEVLCCTDMPFKQLVSFLKAETDNFFMVRGDLTSV